MRKRLTLIALAALLTAPSAFAQTGVKRHEVEVSIAGNYPLFQISGPYSGSERDHIVPYQNCFMFEATVAYRNNLPDIPLALGAEVQFGATARNTGGKYAVSDGSGRYMNYGAGWRTLAASFTVEYDFLRGRKVSPFVGLGAGIGLCQSPLDEGKDMAPIWLRLYPVAPCVTPRVGVEFFNGLRLTLRCLITRKEYSSVSLGIGYAFGGKPVRRSEDF